MKKIYDLGAKTGLNKSELRRVARFGILGLIPFCLAALAGCFQPQRQAKAEGEVVPGQQFFGDKDQPKTPEQGKKTPAKDTNCGPYPGYPCGTRYYTVSRSDFRA